MDPIRDEKRVVTAVFADLVGSTSLAEQLDAQDVRLIVGEAVARMVRAVESYGGTVKDLAGDGCLALFGAPVTHEDDAERAVRTALRITRDIDDYGREVARGWNVDGLAARAGVATGPVVTGMIGDGGRREYAAFGDTVNVAARLQSAAEPGGVLCAASTQRLLADTFEWSAPSQLELKGRSGTVTAFSPLAPARRAGPRHARQAGLQTRLVGRDREMVQLEQAASGLSAGSGAVVIVSGEPGIGKSRLLAELHERLETGEPAPNVQWLEGRCLSYGESLPYWPFRDLLRGWLGVSADDPELRTRLTLRRRIEELYGRQAQEAYPYLANLLDLELEPEADARLADQAPEARQYRTWEVIGELLGRMAASGPLVVVLEDLHWADPTSLGLIERLLGITEDAAVLLLLTHRAERDHPSWRVREVAAREFPHRSLIIDLPALPGEAERELLAGLVGRETLPAAVAERLVTAAEGNPFFLEELVRSMADAGALVRSETGSGAAPAAWRFDHEVPVEVPPTVGQVINARLDRLAPATHDVVRAAAVLGRIFELPLLEGVAQGTSDIPAALRELQRVDLVREARRWPRPEFQFKHVLIQEAAYATLLDDQRCDLHRRAALWLEERYAADTGEVAELLAHHWLAARDEQRAATYLAMAGDRARSQHALDESIGHYRALLPILERRGERQQMAVVLLKLALALHIDLRFAEANAAYQEAFGLWQPPEAPAAPRVTLVLLGDRLPNEVDPPRSYFLPSMQVQYALLDRLVELWPERTIVPSLAEQWTISDDGLRYVFRLRQGLRWSDGEPLTAHDVEYGIKRNFDRQRPGVSVAMFFVIEGVQDYYTGRHDELDSVGLRALDEQHVEFRLNAPAPYFMNVMNRADAGPVPRHAIERDGDAWTDPARQVVSGAFRRVEWSPARVVLERRTDYLGRRSGNVRRVEIIQREPAAAGAALAAGEADVAIVYGDPDHPELLASADPDRLDTPAAAISYLYFRPDQPPFGERAVRLALAHALDRDELAAVVSSRALVARGGLVPPALYGHTPDIAPRFDPKLANALLAQASSRPSFEVSVVPGRPWSIVLEAVVGSWRRVLGLDIGIRELSYEYWLGRAAEERPPVDLAGWFPGYPDPEYFLRLLLHSEAKDNFGGYANPAFDELIERARLERDVRRRLELFHEADRLAVAEEAAVIVLSYERNGIFVKPWVHGWWEYGKAWSSFADLTVDERSPRYQGTTD